MSQDEILTLLTPEWQSTAQIVEATRSLGVPYPVNTVRRNLRDLWLNERADRTYRNHAAYWRLRP